MITTINIISINVNTNINTNIIIHDECIVCPININTINSYMHMIMNMIVQRPAARSMDNTN